MNRGRRGQSGRGRGSTPRSTSRPPSTREYPRTARVNELLREILAEELERIGDPRLEWVSITGVTVNAELSNATVFFSALDGAESDPLALEALAERRVRLQGAVGRQARLRRTPELHFQPDPGVRAGWRVEEILRDIGPFDETDDDDSVPGDSLSDESLSDESTPHELTQTEFGDDEPVRDLLEDSLPAGFGEGLPAGDGPDRARHQDRHHDRDRSGEDDVERFGGRDGPAAGTTD